MWRTYEVFYQDVEAASKAEAELDGSSWKGQQLQARVDARTNGNELLVRGDGPLAPWEELGSLFTAFGPVRYAGLRATGSFWEVRFSSAEEAARAAEALNGTELLQRTVLVEPEGGNSTRAYVYGAPPEVLFKQVKAFLGQAGTVQFLTNHDHTAEVRYETEAEAQLAVERLHGSRFQGYTLAVAPHHRARDATKLLVSGFGAGVRWQDLRDYFGQVGKVSYAALAQQKKRPKR